MIAPNQRRAQEGDLPSRQHPEHPSLLGARYRIALSVALGGRLERLVTKRCRHGV
jgi:hypothetical protein